LDESSGKEYRKSGAGGGKKKGGEKGHGIRRSEKEGTGGEKEKPIMIPKRKGIGEGLRKKTIDSTR